MKTQLTIGELEVDITVKKNGYACLVKFVKFGESKVDVEYEYKPGERAIVNAAPEDCQPGWPASIAICGITTTDALHFEAEGMRYEIDAGQDIFHLLTVSQIEGLQDEIMKGLPTYERDYEREAA